MLYLIGLNYPVFLLSVNFRPLLFDYFNKLFRNGFFTLIELFVYAPFKKPNEQKF